MQLSRVGTTATEFSKSIRKYFGEKIGTCTIYNIDDTPGHEAFNINFSIYNDFAIVMGYGEGHFGWCIPSGDIGLLLPSSQEWYGRANFDVFFKEMDEQIRLRIPDKYLKANGWL